MKIKDFTLYKVPPRWLFLKITTDNGIEGWGEPIVEGKAETVKACVQELSDVLIGEDPLAIEDHWQKMYRSSFYRGGPVLMSAIAGIDQALWDIKGKYYKAPVYELLGGRARDKIEIYSWIGGDRPENVGKEAVKRKEAGFNAIKMNATEEMHYIDSNEKVNKVKARIKAVREMGGEDLGIAVDFHGRVHKGMARVLFKELAEFNLLFIEEPVLSENYESLKDLIGFGIPVALGERLFSRWDFKHILASGYTDIIQPDLSHAGGISEVKKIATMAEAYDVAVAPHCPLGPISLASAVQVDSCTPNVFIQEQSLGIHYNKENDLLDYIENKEIFNFDNGFIPVPEKPGLGIEVDEELVRDRAQTGHNWRNPVWRNDDGTIAEW
ncbi:MAG: galactonate dehydratase [Halanaerobiaceae bacterium]